MHYDCNFIFDHFLFIFHPKGGLFVIFHTKIKIPLELVSIDQIINNYVNEITKLIQCQLINCCLAY